MPIFRRKQEKKISFVCSLEDNIEEIEVEKAIKNVRELKESPKPNERRAEFFKDINNMNEKEFFNKYFPDNIKVKVERTIRKVLAKLGIYNKIKKVAKRILRKN